MNPDDLRTIGIIVAAHGLQGTAKVMSLSSFPMRFLDIEKCYAVREGAIVSELTAKRVKLAVPNVLITFKEIRTREEIENFRGCEICVLEKDAHPVAKGEFYISDLVGYSGVDAEGRSFGVMKEVVKGAQDLLLFETTHGEILIPFVDEWVGDLDESAKTIQVPDWRQFLESQMTDMGDSSDH